ncbi:Uma2 family endonuclease [Streptomyces sp. S07_1.15]|uniref:Uma2 family endonuclease n=1 Tax=Streptomyces sp. S07_1.15 TaxID=2873925 RepID=UPI001D140B54|nr:Uma2 family endonuclease [Streptomyces sp. S07_1.15]MCC3651975.1 Uma2 family endonuclease [Streptomyces sp. S07_1.15]
MSDRAPAAEPGSHNRTALLDEAEWISQRLPGCRVEILDGEITVTPLAGAAHAEALTDVTVQLIHLRDRRTRVVQRVGLWLPGGPSDFAVPDLSVIDGDYTNHLVAYNCYAPAAFRLVLEVTAHNYGNERRKTAAYAAAGIPVYVLADRAERQVHVLTDPCEGRYRKRATYRPGESFALPEAVGEPVRLSADSALGPRETPGPAGPR